MKALILAILIVFSFLSVSLGQAFATPSLQQTVFVVRADYAKSSYNHYKDSPDYSYFARWDPSNLPVKYTINPTGSKILQEKVVGSIVLAADEWDDGSFSNWGGVSTDLLSYSGISTKTYSTLAWTSAGLDGENTIVFGDYPDNNVIAITIVWYTSSSKTIVEFDMVLDTSWTWGDATTNGASVIDLQNIATHELGHAVGLGDLYTRNNAQETMYGYATYGETIKRSLYRGDKEGVTALYGATTK